MERASPGDVALIPFSAFGRQPLGQRIFATLLDRPATELVKEVNRYINTHAPEGSWHKEMTSDEPEQATED